MGLFGFFRKKRQRAAADARPVSVAEDAYAAADVAQAVTEGRRTVETAPDFALELSNAETEALRLSTIQDLSGENIQGLIPSGMRVAGTIRAAQGLKVDGQILGSIEIEGDGLLVIAPGAEVLGSVKAKRALILGTVHGGAVVDSLVVHRQGRLNGEVKYLAAKMMGGQSNWAATARVVRQA